MTSDTSLISRRAIMRYSERKKSFVFRDRMGNRQQLHATSEGYTARNACTGYLRKFSNIASLIRYLKEAA